MALSLIQQTQEVPQLADIEKQRIYTAISSPTDTENMRMMMTSKYGELYYRYLNNYLVYNMDEPLDELKVDNLSYMIQQTMIASEDSSLTIKAHINNIVKLLNDLPPEIYDPVQQRVIVALTEFEDQTPEILKEIQKIVLNPMFLSTAGLAGATATIKQVNDLMVKLKNNIREVIRISTTLSARSRRMRRSPAEHFIREMPKLPLYKSIGIIMSTYGLITGLQYATLNALTSSTSLTYDQSKLLKDAEDEKVETIEVPTGQVKVLPPATIAQYKNYDYLLKRDNADNVDIQWLYPSNDKKFEFYPLAGNTTNTGGHSITAVIESKLNLFKIDSNSKQLDRLKRPIIQGDYASSITKELQNKGISIRDNSIYNLKSATRQELIIMARKKGSIYNYIILEDAVSMSRIRRAEKEIKEGKQTETPDPKKVSKETAKKIGTKPKGKPATKTDLTRADKKQINELTEVRKQKENDIKKLRQEIRDATAELSKGNVEQMRRSQLFRIIGNNQAEIRAKTETIKEIEEQIFNLKATSQKGGTRSMIKARAQILEMEDARLKREMTRAKDIISYNEKVARTKELLEGPRRELSKEIDQYVAELRSLPKTQQKEPVKDMIKRLEQIKKDITEQTKGADIFENKRETLIKDLSSFMKNIQQADQASDEQEIKNNIEKEFIKIGENIRQGKSTTDNVKNIYKSLDSYALLKFNNNMGWKGFKESEMIKNSIRPYQGEKLYNYNPRSFAFGI